MKEGERDERKLRISGRGIVKKEGGHERRRAGKRKISGWGKVGKRWGKKLVLKKSLLKWRRKKPVVVYTLINQRGEGAEFVVPLGPPCTNFDSVCFKLRLF